MSNIRSDIESVIFKSGIMRKHPSGVEVFESKEQIQELMAAIDVQVVEAQEQRKLLQGHLDAMITADCDFQNEEVI